MKKPKAVRGRPPAPLVKAKAVRLRQIDLERLAQLAAKLDRDHSWLIRQGIELLAEREGVE